MLALGLTVTLPTSGRPVVRAVLLEDPFNPTQTTTLADITLATEFDLTTAEAEWARMCSQFSQDVSGRVSTLAPAVVVVRRADFHKNAKPTDGLRLRLVVEGAISAAAMAHAANTHLRTGTACAQEYPHDKETMDADGKTLVSRAYRAEAAGAALSGLFGNRV